MLSKVLLDQQSPYLKSVIINKGFNHGIKLGFAVKEKSYFVGKIINVNFFAMGVFLPKNTEIELLFEYKPKWSKIHKITLIMSFITLCVFNLLLAISPINKYFINLNK